MGIINLGILGGFSGKVGPVVGGNWKGIDYMRGYVIPANPNTPSQQTQRTKFGAMVDIARSILTTIIHTYWDPFAVEMSGFNRFIQANINLLDVSNQFDADCVGSLGTLEPITDLVGYYDDGTGETSVTWTQDVFGNGLLTDSIFFAAYNRITGQLIATSISTTRDDETAVVTSPAGLAGNKIVCICFPFRGTGAEFTVADSLTVYAGDI